MKREKRLRWQASRLRMQPPCRAEKINPVEWTQPLINFVTLATVPGADLESLLIPSNANFDCVLTGMTIVAVAVNTASTAFAAVPEEVFENSHRTS